MTNLKHLVIETLENSKGIDIKSLDVHQLTTMTNDMFIVSGNTSRHVRAIAQHLIKAIKNHALLLLGVEGEREGEWILIDLGDAIVHIMQEQTRSFYNLEKLWDNPNARKSHA